MPLIGLEPSCLAVFRDELTNLFPDDEDAKKLSKQSFVLSEFLNQHVPNYEPPRLQRQAILHGHCHHKSVIGMDDEHALLKKMGIDYTEPQSTCCGMAGSFGFEAGHYDISMQVGELGLLPAVRQANPDTLVIANGFSCETQIVQGTGRRALHLAEVLQLALRERSRVGRDMLDGQRSGVGAPTGLLVGAGLVLGGLALWGLTRPGREAEYSDSGDFADGQEAEPVALNR